MKTRFQEKTEKMKRRYYEVFGDLESTNEFLKIGFLLLLGFLFLLFCWSFTLAKKPPLVIRVSEVGEAQPIQNLESHNAPTEAEISYFSKIFVKRFRELNSYTIARDSAEAWNFMSSDYRKVADRELVDTGFLAKFDGTGLYTRIDFKEEEIERETQDHARISLIGVRTIFDYNNSDYKRSSLYKYELVLKKVPRSRQVPWGLLVENYNETQLKELEEVS